MFHVVSALLLILPNILVCFTKEQLQAWNTETKTVFISLTVSELIAVLEGLRDENASINLFTNNYQSIYYQQNLNHYESKKINNDCHFDGCCHPFRGMQ